MSDVREGVEVIEAADGTEWIYSPEFNIWNGYQPGEDGLWEYTPEEMDRWYPEVIAEALK